MKTVYATIPGGAELNGLPWKPYRYQGTGEDTLTAFMDAEPVWPCGTPLGYSRHKNKREPKCQDCIDAYNRMRREQYAEARS